MNLRQEGNVYFSWRAEALYRFLNVFRHTQKKKRKRKITRFYPKGKCSLVFLYEKKRGNLTLPYHKPARHVKIHQATERERKTNNWRMTDEIPISYLWYVQKAWTGETDILQLTVLLWWVIRHAMVRIHLLLLPGIGLSIKGFFWPNTTKTLSVLGVPANIWLLKVSSIFWRVYFGD